MYAWLALAGIITFGLFLGPLNDTCCLVGSQAAYHTIQAAVDAAPPGSTVVVLPGVYRENVTVDKPLRLLVAGRTLLAPLARGQQYLIQAADATRPALTVRAPEVTVQGFVVRGGSEGIAVRGARRVRLQDVRVVQSHGVGIAVEDAQEVLVKGGQIVGHPRAGIRVVQGRHVRLVGNVVSGNGQGIVLENTRRSLVKANALSGQTGPALRLVEAGDNALLANRFSDNAQGLILERSSGVVLRANRLEAGPDGFAVEGDDVSDFFQDIDPSNTVGGRPVLYLVGLQDRTLQADLEPGYLALIRARNVTLAGLRLAGRSLGALVVAGQDVSLEDVVLDGNGIGLRAYASRGLTLSRVQVINQRGDGLRFENTSEVVVSESTISANGGHGVVFHDGQDFFMKHGQVLANGGSGVRLVEARGGEISQSTFRDNGLQAVLLQRAEAILVLHNALEGNTIGLALEFASKNRVEGNAIRDNEWGIFLQASGANTIRANTLVNNARGGIGGEPADNLIEANDETDSSS